MASTQTHRGPDGVGTFLSDKISMGMCRLAIVDVESGQQPVFSPNGRIVALLNGEIYNHVELRKSLEAEGAVFKSDHSDSEVIPFLFTKYGPDFVKHLVGMFAIAVWDENGETLYLYRDQVGIKPLYFTRQGQRLSFSSEIKALLKLPWVRKAPDPQALSHYFTFKNIPAPLSGFAEIGQLLPGERVTFRRGEIQRTRWWEVPSEELDISFEDARDGIRSRLEESVRLQLRSDVPIGFYLSGGLDSSAVVALASRMIPTKLQTFTLAFEGNQPGKQEDQRCARLMVDRYRTEHHEITLRKKDVPEHMADIARSFDEPYSGTMSTYFLSGLIRQHVKVALSGDGADELFGSYQAHRLAYPLARLAEVVTNGQNPEEIYRSESLDAYGFDLPRLMALLSTGDEVRRRMELHVWKDAEKSSLLHPEFSTGRLLQSSENLMREIYQACRSRDPLNRALYADLRSLLPDQVLAFVDRLSMRHSVEVRPPFLDHRLVEFAFRIPGRYKINAQGRVKHVLKDALADLLPDDIISRSKEGFVVPTDWLLEDNRPYVDSFLNPALLKTQGILNSGTVTDVVDRYYRGDKKQGYKIWNLMMFQLWWSLYFS